MVVCALGTWKQISNHRGSKLSSRVLKCLALSCGPTSCWFLIFFKQTTSTSFNFQQMMGDLGRIVLSPLIFLTSSSKILFFPTKFPRKCSFATDSVLLFTLFKIAQLEADFPARVKGSSCLGLLRNLKLVNQKSCKQFTHHTWNSGLLFSYMDSHQILVSVQAVHDHSRGTETLLIILHSHSSGSSLCVDCTALGCALFFLSKNSTSFSACFMLGLAERRLM